MQTPKKTSDIISEVQGDILGLLNMSRTLLMQEEHLKEQAANDGPMDDERIARHVDVTLNEIIEYTNTKALALLELAIKEIEQLRENHDTQGDQFKQ